MTYSPAFDNFLTRPGPRWLTIPPHRPFLRDLAAALVSSLREGGPESLSNALILAPTRRAARDMAAAFVSVAPTPAVLLPQIRTLGDLDEGEPPFEPGDLIGDLPPAISVWRRRFELAGLAAQAGGETGRELEAGEALRLADALGALVDAWHLEEVPFEEALVRLGGLSTEAFAEHWRVSAVFLQVALTAWPERLASLGAMDATARRTALTRRLAERWLLNPPQGVVVAAGSTGSASATAALLNAIAQAPCGAVVLPGLDLDLADDAWAEVDDQHPQASMKRLLESAGCMRADVRPLTASPTPGDMRGRWRHRVINEALRPPDLTADWLAVISRLRAESGDDALADGLKGLSLVETRHEEETAAAAALLLRETLEIPGKTAALVCPDAALARRVSARLRRWGIVADSSAGRPLASARAATLVSLLSRAAVDPTDPVIWLSVAKHPFTRLGLTPDDLDRARRRLELRGLRGPRPRDLAELQERLLDEEDARLLADRLGAAFSHAAAAFAEGPAPAAVAARALAEALERLAEGPRGGTGDLWSGAGGEVLARLLSDFMTESEGLPPLTASGFLRLLQDALASEILRTGDASHPRLKILGVLEARLVSADRIILAGLEEGVWPRFAQGDPFLSRPMRAAVGLPPPERRIGLSAHDFVQAACAPEAVLLVSRTSGGSPAVPSRWIWRLRVLARGGGLDLPSRPDLLGWARSLDGPLTDPPPELRPAPPPSPRPPVAARPRRLGVTQVETWIRDPYALYARHVLDLRPLAPPDEEVDARRRGDAVHMAFERFARAYPDDLPEDAEARFVAILSQSLKAAGMGPARMAREGALAPSIACFAIDLERRRRPFERLALETRGEMVLAGPAGPFHLTAKADRLEIRPDGVDVLDFKTGTPPSQKAVNQGLAPQLTLTAAIVETGGFAEIGARPSRDLVYIQVRGGRRPGRPIAIKNAVPIDAVEGLKRRIARFDNAAQPYLSGVLPHPHQSWAGDYDHLARVWEWRVVGEEPEGEGEGPDTEGEA